MPDEKQKPKAAVVMQAGHKADAYIPTETFEEMVEDQMTPAQKEYAQQVMRLSVYSGFFVNNKDAGLGAMPMLIDCFVHKFVFMANTVILAKYVQEKLGVSSEDYLKEVSTVISQLLSVAEQKHRVIITPEAVFTQDGGGPKQ